MTASIEDDDGPLDVDETLSWLLSLTGPSTSTPLAAAPRNGVAFSPPTASHSPQRQRRAPTSVAGHSTAAHTLRDTTTASTTGEPHPPWREATTDLPNRRCRDADSGESRDPAGHTASRTTCAEHHHGEVIDSSNGQDDGGSIPSGDAYDLVRADRRYRQSTMCHVWLAWSVRLYARRRYPPRTLSTDRRMRPVVSNRHALPSTGEIGPMSLPWGGAFEQWATSRHDGLPRAGANAKRSANTQPAAASTSSSANARDSAPLRSAAAAGRAHATASPAAAVSGDGRRANDGASSSATADSLRGLLRRREKILRRVVRRVLWAECPRLRANRDWEAYFTALLAGSECIDEFVRGSLVGQATD